MGRFDAICISGQRPETVGKRGQLEKKKKKKRGGRMGMEGDHAFYWRDQFILEAAFARRCNTTARK